MHVTFERGAAPTRVPRCSGLRGRFESACWIGLYNLANGSEVDSKAFSRGCSAGRNPMSLESGRHALPSSAARRRARAPHRRPRAMSGAAASTWARYGSRWAVGRYDSANLAPACRPAPRQTAHVDRQPRTCRAALAPRQGRVAGSQPSEMPPGRDETRAARAPQSPGDPRQLVGARTCKWQGLRGRRHWAARAAIAPQRWQAALQRPVWPTETPWGRRRARGRGAPHAAHGRGRLSP